MFRTLSVRAIVPVAVAVTGFVIVCCLQLYSVMKSDMINDTIIHETNLTDTVTKSARYAMLKSDREMLGNIIANVGDQKGVEHLRIFNKKGLVAFSANPKEINQMVDKKSAGCISCHAGPVPVSSLGSMERARRFKNERGTEVLAITAPIYNEPACYNGQCHFHTADQKVLGTLDIGLSAAPLLRTLSVMRGRMIVFSVMILILTVGGVAALLRRQVFMPLRELEEFTLDLKDGKLDREFKGFSGELTDLVDNMREITGRLKDAEQEIAALKKGTERKE